MQIYFKANLILFMARKKITISLQDTEIKLIDERAKSLGMTRSGYLRGIAFRDIARKIDKKDVKKRRIADFIS